MLTVPPDCRAELCSRDRDIVEKLLTKHLKIV
jgi:hypothetical protein